MSKEILAQWMIQHGYTTGHGDTMEDLLAELDWQIAENWTRAMINGVETEREACAKVCEHFLSSKENDDAWIIAMDLALQAAAAVIRRREKQ